MIDTPDLNDPAVLRDMILAIKAEDEARQKAEATMPDWVVNDLAMWKVLRSMVASGRTDVAILDDVSEMLASNRDDAAESWRDFLRSRK